MSQFIIIFGSQLPATIRAAILTQPSPTTTKRKRELLTYYDLVQVDSLHAISEMAPSKFTFILILKKHIYPLVLPSTIAVEVALEVLYKVLYYNYYNNSLQGFYPCQLWAF